MSVPRDEHELTLTFAEIALGQIGRWHNQQRHEISRFGITTPPATSRGSTN